MIAQNHHKMAQMTYLRQNLHDQVKLLEKKKKHIFHDHRLSPLPMQNPYSKFLLVIKTLFVHRFSKFLQVLLGQTKIKILTWKYFSDIPNTKVQVGKDQEKAQSEKDSHSKNRDGKN